MPIFVSDEEGDELVKSWIEILKNKDREDYEKERKRSIEASRPKPKPALKPSFVTHTTHGS